MTKFLAVTMFVVLSLFSGQAMAKGDGPEGVSFVASVGGLKFPGVEAMNYDIGVNLRLKGEMIVWRPANLHFTMKNDWSLTFLLGSDARLGYSPIYRLERPILTVDAKWQFSAVIGWRLIARVVFSQEVIPGIFTGPSFTFLRTDHVEWDVAVVGGKFLGQPGATDTSNGDGAAMAVFRLVIGSS